MMPARQELPEGCGVGSLGSLPSLCLAGASLNLLNPPDIPWRASPCQHTGSPLWVPPPALKGARRGLWGCSAENGF